VRPENPYECHCGNLQHEQTKLPHMRDTAYHAFNEGQQSLIDAGYRPVPEVGEIENKLRDAREYCVNCTHYNSHCPKDQEDCFTMDVRLVAQSLHDWLRKGEGNEC